MRFDIESSSIIESGFFYGFSFDSEAAEAGGVVGCVDIFSNGAVADRPLG